MSSGWDSLLSEPYFWPLVTLVVGGLIALVVAIVIGRRVARRHKLLCWTVVQTTIVSGLNSKLSGLELRYRGNPIPSATLAVLTVWNAGTEAILHEALGTHDKLRVTVPEGVEVHDVSVVPVAGGAEGVVPAWSPSHPSTDFALTFDFINSETGFVIQVVHTGTPNQVVGLAGTLVDVPPLVKVAPARWYLDRILLYGCVVVGFAIGIFANPFPRGSNAQGEFLVLVGVGLGFGVPILMAKLDVVDRLKYSPPGILKEYAKPPVAERR